MLAVGYFKRKLAFVNVSYFDILQNTLRLQPRERQLEPMSVPKIATLDRDY